MRLASAVCSDPPGSTPTPLISELAEVPRDQLWLANLPLKRAPSQKELASVFGITTRHLRRWEDAEKKAGRLCTRPYGAAELWQLYQHRRRTKWNRAEAVRLQLVELLDEFDLLLGGTSACFASDDPTHVAELMLRALVMGEAGTTHCGKIAGSMHADLASVVKSHLRAILTCPAAHDVLVHAFFHATLLAAASPRPRPHAPANTVSA